MSTASQKSFVKRWHNCMSLWEAKETSKDGQVCDLGLRKFVEYFHVFPTSYLRRCKGPAVRKETCKRWKGRKMLCDTFFRTHDDARDQIFRTLSSGNTEIRQREHRVYWFPTSVCLLCTSAMVVIANFWTKWWFRFTHGMGTCRVVGNAECPRTT